MRRKNQRHSCDQIKTSTNKDIYLYIISRQESKKEKQIEMHGIYQCKCTVRSPGLQIKDQENHVFDEKKLFSGTVP